MRIMTIINTVTLQNMCMIKRGSDVNCYREFTVFKGLTKLMFSAINLIATKVFPMFKLFSLVAIIVFHKVNIVFIG